MGWWSTTIMGGDLPLDAQGDMFDIVFEGTPYEDGCTRMDAEDEGELTREDIADAIHNSLPNLFEHIMSIDSLEYQYISKQVLGVLILEYGVPISDNTRQALELATSGAGDDEWAYENDERREHIKSFIKQLREYNGQPSEVAYEGLLEKIFDEMQDD